ncbi:MAG: class I SAM-dependent methyltransferase [Myxococcales bacterium]
MLRLARRFKDLGIKGRKARQYDAFSRSYRLEELRRYAELAAGRLQDRGSVLEIASGPGYFCLELAKAGRFRLTGLDISHDLVEIARANARQAGVRADFLQGNASTLAFPDAIFDLVFCSWALKNFKDPVAVLKETYRVLKPGGTALLVDLNRGATGEEWNEYASRLGLRGAAALAMKLAFRIQRTGAYSREQLEAQIEQTPFRVLEIERSGINLCARLSTA